MNKSQEPILDSRCQMVDKMKIWLDRLTHNRQKYHQPLYYTSTKRRRGWYETLQPWIPISDHLSFPLTNWEADSFRLAKDLCDQLTSTPCITRTQTHISIVRRHVVVPRRQSCAFLTLCCHARNNNVIFYILLWSRDQSAIYIATMTTRCAAIFHI